MVMIQTSFFWAFFSSPVSVLKLRERVVPLCQFQSSSSGQVWNSGTSQTGQISCEASNMFSPCSVNTTFYMTYSKLVFWLLWGIEINLPVPYSGLILTIEKV